MPTHTTHLATKPGTPSVLLSYLLRFALRAGGAALIMVALVGYATPAHALTVYEQTADNGDFQTTNGSYCFQGPNDSCLGSFVLTETTQFTKDVSRLYLSGIRVPSGSTDTCFNISNITVTDSIAFCGNTIGTSFGVVDALMTTVDSPVNLPAGTYYIWANQTVVYEFHGESSRDITGWVTTDGSTPEPPDTTARFTSAPIIDTVNQTVTFQGIWNASTTSEGSQYFRTWQTSQTLGLQQEHEYLATTTGAFSLTFPLAWDAFSISATSTSYTLSGGLQIFGQILAEPLYFNPNATILAATSTSQTATTTTVDTGSAESLSGLPEPADCSLGALTGCIKNAAVWLFYPPANVTGQFKNLSLQGRFPFEYAYDVGELRDELFSSPLTASATFSVTTKFVPGQATSTITLMSAAMLSGVPYSGFIKTVLAWLIWLMVAEFIYYRVIRVHDTHTPT